MLVYRKLTEKNNNSIKPSGRDNYNDIFANIKHIQQILNDMYQGLLKAEKNSLSGERLDKVVPLVHKIRSAAQAALTETNYRLR